MKLFSFIAATAFSLDLNGVWVNRDGDLYQFDEEKLFIIGNDNSVQQTTFSTIEVNGISILMFTDRGNRRGGTIDEATETINFGADFGILQRFDEERNGDPTTTETPATTTLFAPSPFADISGEWTAPDGTVYALVENDAGTGVNIFATNDAGGLVSMIQDAAVAFNADGSVTITGNSIAGTTTGPFEMVVASSKNDATINGVAGTIKNDPITTTAASTSAPAGTTTAAPPAASSTTASAPTTAPPGVTSPAASTTAPGGDTGINPGVGTTTAAPGGTNSTMPGSGSGDGDPHFVIEHDEFDALCFDANPLGADAIELLQDGNVDIVGHLADANFSKQKRVFDGIVFTTLENKISVTAGEFSVDNDVFEIKEDMEPMIFSGFKVYVRPQAYFKHQGIEIRFDDGSKYITHEKQHGDKMSLGVEFDIPNVSHASGLLGAALKPNLYVIEDDKIVTDHGEIPLFATSWNHHSFCHFLEEDQLENLIGTPLTAFYRQRADLLEFNQPK